MSKPTDFLGEQVLEKKGGQLVDLAGLVAGKVLGIYFSAHWCPPCRGFTPQLAKWYTKMKESDKKDKMEMVFVSSDKDQESFDQYFAEMPWHALPFEKRDLKAKCSQKFKVQGIPTLVFIDGDTGKLITKDGRSKVMKDPEGFPWPPKTLEQMLNGPLLNADGEVQATEALKGKVKGIYFSAHWCPPCRGFTPELVQTYNRVKEAGNPFEIVFASWDRDEDDFEEYFKEMPWLSFPYDDNRIAELGNHFEVDGIPNLVLLDENNEIISTNARGAIEMDKEGKDFPWIPKPLEVLNSYNASNLNETPCLLFFTGGNEDLIKMAKDSMTEPAEKFREKFKAKKDEDPTDLLFMYQGTEDNKSLLSSLREFLGLTEKYPQVILVNLEETGVFVSQKETFTKDDIKEIVSQFNSGELPFDKIRGGE